MKKMAFTTRHHKVCELSNNFELLGSVWIYPEAYADKRDFLHITLQEYLVDEQTSIMELDIEGEKLLVQNYPVITQGFHGKT